MKSTFLEGINKNFKLQARPIKSKKREKAQITIMEQKQRHCYRPYGNEKDRKGTLCTTSCQ